MATYSYTHGGGSSRDRLRFLLGDHRGSSGSFTGTDQLWSDEELNDCLEDSFSQGQLTTAAALALHNRLSREAIAAGASGTVDSSLRPQAIAEAIRSLAKLSGEPWASLPAWSSSSLLGSSSSLLEHSSLLGLTSDDHQQYALLAGRAAGQSLYGSNASGGSLTLNGNSVGGNNHVLLGDNLTVDCTNGRIGHRVTPTYPLDILGLDQTGARETLARFRVADGGNDQWGIANGTSDNSKFAPLFYGYRDASSDKASMSMRGMVSSGADTGTEQVLTLQAMRSSSGSDPNNGTFSDIATRPLLAFVDRSGTKKTLIVSPSWKLGLGQTSPAAMLHSMALTASDPLLITEGISSQTGLHWQLRGNSSTTAGRSIGAIDGTWHDATDSTRKGRLTIGAYDTTTFRECFRAEGNSAARLSFYGAAAVAQQVLNSYTSDAEGSSYSGIDNAQAGSVYAKVADLNQLRTAYETLRAMADDLRSKLISSTLVA